MPLKTPFQHLTQFPLNNPLHLMRITTKKSLGSTPLATGTNPGAGGFDIPSGTATLEHKYWLFRVGLNYKFGTW